MILPLISALTSVIALVLLKEYNHISAISSATTKAPYQFKVISLLSNQYTEWLNPLFFLRTNFTPNGDIIGYLAIFAAGFSLIITPETKNSNPKAAIQIFFSTITTIFVAAVVADDLVLASVFAVIPWLYLGLSRLPSSYSSLQRSVFLIISLFPIITIFTLGNAPFIPDYPAGSYLVPLTGFAGFPRPMVGPAPPLQLIDRGLIRTVYLWPAVLGLILTTSLLLLPKIRVASTPPTFLMVILLFLCACLDTIPSEPYAVIAPLQTISRIFPGASFIAITPIFVLCGYILLLKFLFDLSARHGTFALLIVTILGITYTQQIYSKELLSPWKDCLHLHSKAGVAGEDLCRNELISPSYRIYREIGYERIASTYRRWAARSAPIPNFSQLFTSNGASAEALQLMTDRNPKTRWSSGGGRQRGDEWLLLLLPSSHNRLAGLDLQTTRYYTDFPRGVVVLTSSKCFSAEEVAKITTTEFVKGAAVSAHGFSPAFQRSEWVGPIILASDGTPAYGRQGDVRLQFDQTIEACSILIRQTGEIEGFDWSVAEIKLLERL